MLAVMVNGATASTSSPCPLGPGLLQGPFNADNLPNTIPASCGLAGKLILDHGVGIYAPAAGEGTYAASLNANGSGQEFAVESDSNGTLTLKMVGASEPVGAVSSLSQPDPCYDDANQEFAQESDQRIWWYKMTSTPSELTNSDALAAIRAGVNDMTHAENDCIGQGWGNAPTNNTASYSGTTSRTADISAGSCQSSSARDGVNVVDFGDLPTGELGLTCAYYFPVSNEMTEADIRFNKFDATWTTNPLSTTCSNRYDVESVSAHEHGHSFGLSHVAENGHGLLTMSPTLQGPCERVERTLGRGDWLGISS
jgi:hypothetical protein